MDIDIKRIDSYKDSRFRQTVLNQHGAYVIGTDPYEVEIIGPQEASVRGKNPECFPDLIEEFRFHAPHIIRFYNDAGDRIAAFPEPEITELRPEQIQPSQFFIDEDKVKAVQTFIHKAEDIVIQVIPYGDRFISLDGHTRLYLAVQNDFRTVRAVVSETDEWVWAFVHEAEKRGIRQPGDMKLLSHEQYEIQWNQYCDKVFENEAVSWE